jgi:tetratricopeptide (TPR) repeat protein
MAETEGAFRLTFVQGRGLLSLTGRDFENLGRVDRLELEIPNLSFPFDMSGGVARFKNRRLRLRELSLSVGAAELKGFLTRAPLGDFGIFDPLVTIEGTRLTLCARVVLGDREVEMTALAALSTHSPRGVSLCVYDVRAYGFLPVPAPLVVMALFSALGAESPVSSDHAADSPLPPLLHIRGPAEIRLELCDLVMLAILPMHGWRLPERSQVQLRVAGGGAHATRLPLRFSLEDARTTADDPLLDIDLDPEAYEMREFAARCAPVEAALARGDVTSALGQLRASSPLDGDDRMGAARLLQLLLAGASTLTEAGELAQAALVRWSDFVPGLLALAVVASERGQSEEAAELFERVAQLSAARGRGEDEHCALLAAARQWASAGQPEQALATLERSLLYRSSLRPVARAKIMKKAVEGGWGELLKAIGEESAVSEPDVRDEVAQVMELARQGGVAKDTGLVTQAAEALEAILLREQWPDASLSRGEVAYQMGLVLLGLGDDQAASHWFATSIEGDAPGPVVAEAWRALVDLLARKQDHARTAEALVGWAGDSRSPEGARERAKHLLDAADITLRELHSTNDAAALLERALALSPADPTVLPTVLSALEGLGQTSGNWTSVIAILRRHLGAIRPDDGKTVLRALGRLLVEKTNQQAEAKEAFRVLLDLSPDDEEAIFYSARLTWDAGDRKGAALGYAGIAAASALAWPKVAEAHLRLAQILFADGKADEARQHIDRGLQREPDGARVAVLVEALGEIGNEDRLHELLAARESAAPEGEDRQRIRRALAVAAERRGDLAQAETLYRALHAERPGDIEVIDCLASLCKRQSRPDELLHWLDKLWVAVDGEDRAGTGAIDRVAVGTDLATLLARDPAGKPRAEAILRRLAEMGPIAPTAPAVLDALHQLLVERGAFDEASKVFAQRLGVTPEQGVSSLLLARSRLCLAQPEGLRPALSMLQTIAVEELDKDVLTLRADLAEKAGDVADAISCLSQLRAHGEDEDQPGLVHRLVDLASRAEIVTEVAISVLEKLRAEGPDNLFVAKALFEVSGRLADPVARNRAWRDLLARVPALPDLYRARLQVALSEAAESEGDLQGAEQMLAEAATLDQSPDSRVAQLVMRARLLVARGEIAEAAQELEAALGLNPASAGALALAGELAYRSQEWDKARTAYNRLTQVPGAASVMSAETLAFRRAELAEMFGDHVEAEVAYREVVALDPSHEGAREALAGFALSRGDFAEAALHLREVLRLLPKESVDALTQARQRLGQVYLGLGDLPAARQNLELALASDPDRAATLELTITTYQRLGLHKEAAALCERLSRILADPAKKADALFRKGEILRASLADTEGASDAYLRASDLDPSFAPTLVRLVSYYWSRAELANLADVGADLVHAAPVPKVDEDDMGLLVAVAALLARNDEALAKSALASPLLGFPLRPELAAIRLGELVSRVDRGALHSLDAAMKCIVASAPPDFEVELRGAALRGVMNDPGDAGQAMVLARILDRRGQVSLARAAYCLAHFIDPGIGADGRLADLGEGNTPRAGAFAPGVAVHPLCRGPLRKVLHHLAPAFASVGGRSTSPLSSVGLLPETVAICEDLRIKLAAPPIPFVAHGEGTDVTFTATQPLCILIGRKAEALSAADLRFFTARALEQARAGTLAVLRMSQGNLRGMLRAVLRVAGAPGTPFEIDEETADQAAALWTERLRRPEISALIPLDKAKEELIDSATRALANPPELDSYIRGCRYTADRMGLLASGRPLAALRALAGLLKVDSAATSDEATLARRQEQLRASPALSELVAFMLSEEYGALVEGA